MVFLGCKFHRPFHVYILCIPSLARIGIFAVLVFSLLSLDYCRLYTLFSFLSLCKTFWSESDSPHQAPVNSWSLYSKQIEWPACHPGKLTNFWHCHPQILKCLLTFGYKGRGTGAVTFIHSTRFPIVSGEII